MELDMAFKKHMFIEESHHAIDPTAFFTLLLSIAGLLGLQGSAAGYTITTQPVSSCKPYGNSNIANLLSQSDRIFNNTNASMRVVCPLTGTSTVTPVSFWGVYVDGDFGTASGSCTVFSYSYRHVLLGSASVTLTGVLDSLIPLPVDQIPPYSYQTVSCTLPAKTSLWDLEPYFE